MNRKFIFPVIIFIFILISAGVAGADLPFDAVFNYRQTGNDCGPYSVKAVLTILNKKEADLKEILKQLKPYRMKNNYTLPAGIEYVLRSRNCRLKILNLYYENTENKILKLKEQLSLNRPVIILIGTGNYQHYITLLGYDENVFFIYDSLVKTSGADKLYTEDHNGSLPGNKNIRHRELIAMWDKGGMYGLYRNYAIAAFL